MNYNFKAGEKVRILNKTRGCSVRNIKVNYNVDIVKDCYLILRRSFSRIGGGFADGVIYCFKDGKPLAGVFYWEFGYSDVATFYS